jgi:hypothetical protein
MFDPAFPQPIALTSSECLKLINLKPTTDVEIHLVPWVTYLFIIPSLWKGAKAVWQKMK